MFQSPILVHASAIAIGGQAVLLRGPSGSGKSDLALRLIDEGAELIADDQVWLSLADAAIACSCPPRLAGLLEVRGLGPVRLKSTAASATLALITDLKPHASIARVAASTETTLLGRPVPALSLCAFDRSAPARIRLALRLIAEGSFAVAEADAAAPISPIAA